MCMKCKPLLLKQSNWLSGIFDGWIRLVNCMSSALFIKSSASEDGRRLFTQRLHIEYVVSIEVLL